MPIGIIKYAQASRVMPFNLAVEFSRIDSFEGMTLMNEYNGGQSQRRHLVDNVRYFWQATFRLTAAKLEELRNFYLDMDGPMQPFYFYDVTETVDFAYDTEGDSAVGKHTVRFAMDWEEELQKGSLRGTVTIRLAQLAPPSE